jgi:peroxiredoxin
LPAVTVAHDEVKTAAAATAAAVAATAPDFCLPDSEGNRVALSDLLARGGPVVVVFFRGHWCPYCRRYLARLQGNHRRLREGQATLVAISPEPPETSARLARGLGLEFAILSDRSGETIEAYGARNRFTRGRAVLPHAAVFVVDPAGTIRFGSIDRDFKRRTTVRRIRLALDAIRGAAG